MPEKGDRKTTDEMGDNDKTTIYEMGNNDKITIYPMQGDQDDAFAFLEKKMKGPCGKIVKSVDTKPGNRQTSTYESAEYVFFNTDIDKTKSGKTDAEIMKVLYRDETKLSVELKMAMKEYGEQLFNDHVEQIRIVKTVRNAGLFRLRRGIR